MRTNSGSLKPWRAGWSSQPTQVGTLKLPVLEGDKAATG
jgi:hypothetical protein